MSVDMLNVNLSDEMLHEVHGKDDYYWYLRSEQFVDTFLRPVAALVNCYGDPVLDVGCGEGVLASLTNVPYVGIDGSGSAVSKAFKRHPRGIYYQNRIEDPCIVGEFPTVVMSGILEVLIKPERRVDFMEMYRERFKTKRFIVCDLERLDESAITVRYGWPTIWKSCMAADPFDGSIIEDVKRFRKIIVWEVKP